MAFLHNAVRAAFSAIAGLLVFSWTHYSNGQKGHITYFLFLLFCFSKVNWWWWWWWWWWTLNDRFLIDWLIDKWITLCWRLTVGCLGSVWLSSSAGLPPHSTTYRDSLSDRRRRHIHRSYQTHPPTHRPRRSSAELPWEKTPTEGRPGWVGLRENTIYIVIYKTALFFVARFLLPFSALAYFNTRLILTIRESARLPMKSVEGGRGRQLRRRERYTLTLVVVVIVFVVCELPDLFLRSWFVQDVARSYAMSERRAITTSDSARSVSNLAVNSTSCQDLSAV